MDIPCGSEPAREAGAAVSLKRRGDAFASRLAPTGACFSRAPVSIENVIYCVIPPNQSEIGCEQESL
ncbi:hypothetical protein DM828_09385 [Pseudomonas umsongensis]|nr:hypothetical protein [Pseudomonas umsongensis]